MSSTCWADGLPSLPGSGCRGSGSATTATFAGHASLDSTMRYIHLSGRDLSDKLSRGMAQIHQWRVGMLTEQPDAAAAGVTSSEPG